jgi:hypothetical protein
MSSTEPLFAPMKGAEDREIGGVQLDAVRAGRGRVKRMVYPSNGLPRPDLDGRRT